MGLQVVKGFFDIELFLEAYRNHGVDTKAALVHFRITTRGHGMAENCHPFTTFHGAIVHNGTIGNLGKDPKGPSDTALFAKMIDRLDADQLRSLRPMIEEYLDWSKVAFLSHDGDVVIFNFKQWELYEGAFYSNDGYAADSLYHWVPTTKTLAFGNDDPVEAGLDGWDDEEKPRCQWLNGKFYVYDERLDSYVRDDDLEEAILEDWENLTNCDTRFDVFDDNDADLLAITADYLNMRCSEKA
jgi:hypothetical protein